MQDSGTQVYSVVSQFSRVNISAIGGLYDIGLLVQVSWVPVSEVKDIGVEITSMHVSGVYVTGFHGSVVQVSFVLISRVQVS